MSCWLPANLVSLGKHLDHLGGVDGLVKDSRLGRRGLFATGN